MSRTADTLARGSAAGAARGSRLHCLGIDDTAGSPPAAAAQQTRHLPVRGVRAVGRGLTGRPAPVLGDTRTRAGGTAGPWGTRGTCLRRLCHCSKNVFVRERPHAGRGARLPRVALPGCRAGFELRKSDCRGSDAELFTTSGRGNRLAGPTQRGGLGHSDSESVDLYLKSKLPLMKGSASEDTALL